MGLNYYMCTGEDPKPYIYLGNKVNSSLHTSPAIYDPLSFTFYKIAVEFSIYLLKIEKL